MALLPNRLNRLRDGLRARLSGLIAEPPPIPETTRANSTAVRANAINFAPRFTAIEQRLTSLEGANG